VINGNEEVIRLPPELAREWAFIEVFDDIVANKPPELARRDPDAALEANYFC
jgi:hypothetical protein